MKTKHKMFIANIISLFLKPFFSKNYIHTRNGIRWRLDLNEGIDLLIFLFGTSERKIKNINKFFNPHDKITVLDIGANVGSISLPIAKIFTKSKVYSIEPTNYAYKKLNQNLNLNKSLIKNISLNQLFISKVNKPSKVWSSWNFTSEKNKHKKNLGSLRYIKKKSYITLDKFIFKNKIKKIDFIKLDVDGHELDVLKSGEKEIKKKKPIIFMEIAPYLYPEFGYECHELIEYILKVGYLFYDDNVEKIKDINNYIDRISIGSSKNFYLIYKT
tara:strand:+ start:215 stop:1030 length:816 start_codon:yes stop_codon:yes gene_type:complete